MREFIAVILIIGILATIAIPRYITIQEQSLDNEAKANLKLIRAAEKIYYMEQNSYYPPSGSQSNIDAINLNLKLVLSSGSNRNWNYIVWSTGCSRSTRNETNGRSWFLTINDTDGEPNSGAGCP